MKKSFIPKINEKQTAKKDKHGNLITSIEAIKSLYINTYSHRLGEKDIQSDMKYLKERITM